MLWQVAASDDEADNETEVAWSLKDKDKAGGDNIVGTTVVLMLQGTITSVRA